MNLLLDLLVILGILALDMSLVMLYCVVTEYTECMICSIIDYIRG